MPCPGNKTERNNNLFIALLSSAQQTDYEKLELIKGLLFKINILSVSTRNAEISLA